MLNRTMRGVTWLFLAVTALVGSAILWTEFHPLNPHSPPVPVKHPLETEYLGPQVYSETVRYILRHLESNARIRVPHPDNDTRCGWKRVAPDRFEVWGVIVGTNDTAAVTNEWTATVLKTDIWRVKTLKIGDTVVKE
jgi:hypothetical protein